jgi:D-proline reductase (dithiol) PrdB
MEIARACIPYTPLRRELKDCRVALVTTAGAYLTGMAPFNPDNDLSFRLIPDEAETQHVHFVPGHFDLSWADQDANCLFPLDRLRELQAAGEIGKVAENHISMGLTTELRKLKEQVSWDIAAAIQKTRSDIVVLTGG